jgi:hypothetical protein
MYIDKPRLSSVRKLWPKFCRKIDSRTWRTSLTAGTADSAAAASAANAAGRLAAAAPS